MAVEEQIALAEAGRQFWNQFTEKFQIDRSKIVILMPEEGEEYHKELLENLLDFMGQMKISECHILTEQEETKKQIFEWQQQNQQVLEANQYQLFAWKQTRKEIRSLIQLNLLYKFTNRLIIDAFRGVQDTDAGNLTGVCGITKRDIVRIAVLGLPD